MSTTLGTSTQVITSKNTSINSTKLPAVYNKINWNKLMKEWMIQNGGENPIGIVLDYGCGRYTDHIQDFVNSKGFYYLGYDPYWKNVDFANELDQISKINGGGLAAVVCSNVLNVIPWWEGVKRVSSLVHYLGYLARNRYFLTIYEGNKSGVGQETKKDCWQWNKTTDCYLFTAQDDIKKGVITHIDSKGLVK